MHVGQAMHPAAAEEGRSLGCSIATGGHSGLLSLRLHSITVQPG